MPRMLKALTGMLATLALALSLPVAAQDAPDPVGEWTGVLASPQGELPLVLYIARDEEGAYSAELESVNQAPGRRIPVTEIAVANDVLSWRVAPIAASYEGRWNAEAEEWQGSFSQGITMDLAFSRGMPEALPVVEGLDGTWRGSMELNGVTLRLVLNVVTGERGTLATLDSPDQMANGLPLANFARDGDAVSFDFAPGGQSFAGALDASGSVLEGTWSSPNITPTPVTFTRESETVTRTQRNRPQTPEEPFPYRVEQVAFDNPQFDDVHLAATLTLPEGDGPFPAAVLITGSGPQDRDETLLGHKPFAVIADHLTRNGIAVLRYDDRGVGASTGNYAEATSADLATDANAAAAYLQTRDDIDHAAIGFIGHSEGGMIGPIAMVDNPAIAYLVMLAGPGTNLEQLLLSQRRLIGAQMGMGEEQLASSATVFSRLFNAIASEPTFEDAQAAARAMLTPETMVALGAPAETDPDLILNQLATRWFHYFLRYDPVPNLARIDVPILALNGSLDLQVPADDNLGAIEVATAGNPDVTIVKLDGLNHLFQTATTGSVGEYADIEETFSPRALDAMTEWLRERFVTP